VITNEQKKSEREKQDIQVERDRRTSLGGSEVVDEFQDFTDSQLCRLEDDFNSTDW